MNTAIQDARDNVQAAQRRVDELTQLQASTAAQLLTAEAALRCAYSAMNRLKKDDLAALARARNDELAQIRNQIAAAKLPLANAVDPVSTALARANFSPESVGAFLANADARMDTEQASEFTARADERFRVRVGQLVATEAWQSLDPDAKYDTLHNALHAARGEELRIFHDLMEH